MVDWIMSFAGYVFLIVFGMLVLQFSVIIASVLKKPKNYPENYPSVSVIIPAYNEEKSIAKTIQNVMEADYPSEIEILVIDDGSKDKTQDVVKKFNSVKLFGQKHSGKVAALNFGTKMAKNEIILTIDSDTLIEKSTIKNIVKPFADKNVGAVSGQLKVSNPNGVWGIFQSIEYVYNSMLREAFSSVTKSCVISFAGALVAYRKSLLDKLGGFGTYTETEDFDIAVRIEKAGYMTQFEKTAIGHTSVPASWKGIKKQRIRWWKGGIQTISKNITGGEKTKNILTFVYFNFIFWSFYSLFIMPIVLYQIAYWLPFNLSSSFDAAFYLFRWLSLLGPAYALYKIPEWGVSFFSIFGILSAIVYTAILSIGIHRFSEKFGIKKILAVFFFFPYTLVLNILMIAGSIKYFVSRGKGTFIN